MHITDSYICYHFYKKLLEVCLLVLNRKYIIKYNTINNYVMVLYFTICASFECLTLERLTFLDALYIYQLSFN